MIQPNDLILHAARADALFVGRFISSLRSVPANVGSVATFSLAPFLSLFAHESYARLSEIDSAVASHIRVSRDAATTIARSRNSLKLFEDTKRGLQGQLDYFADALIPAYHEHFIGSAPSIFRFLRTDLGISYYKGNPVSTTHSATFALGHDPSTLLGGGSEGQLRDVAGEYGRYFAGWGAVLDEGAKSFVTPMVPSKLRAKDVRSEREYRYHFNGQGTPALNCLLLVFQCMLNTAALLIPLDEQPESTPTVLKVQLLSVYQVLSSLRVLVQTRQADLSADSLEYIRMMLDDSFAKLVLARSMRDFRNTLMHYRPQRGVDLGKLALDAPLYGLVEGFFELELASFTRALSDLISHSAGVMNRWSSCH